MFSQHKMPSDVSKYFPVKMKIIITMSTLYFIVIYTYIGSNVMGTNLLIFVPYFWNETYFRVSQNYKGDNLIKKYANVATRLLLREKKIFDFAFKALSFNKNIMSSTKYGD